MTIKDATPQLPPIPKTFNLGLNADETTKLIASLKDQLIAIPAEVSAGNMSFCNIRFATALNQPHQTAQVTIQFLPVVTKPAVAVTPAVPAASSTVPAATTPVPAATPAPASTAAPVSK